MDKFKAFRISPFFSELGVVKKTRKFQYGGIQKLCIQEGIGGWSVFGLLWSKIGSLWGKIKYPKSPVTPLDFCLRTDMNYVFLLPKSLFSHEYTLRMYANVICIAKLEIESKLLPSVTKGK